MRWISEFQLFLFDLDGLLVNTEELHFGAYKRMVERRGYFLPWSFTKYFSIAQQDAEAPKRHIYQEFPELLKEEPNWSVLYAEKKKAFLELLETESAPLMPGVEQLLSTLMQYGVKRVVVTHSPRHFVDILCEKNPVLQTIPNWITREDYDMPKPAPDGYLKAIAEFAKPNDKVVGFEDSSRGLRSLMATSATPVLINSIDDALCASSRAQGVKVFSNFFEVMQQDTLLS
ncbi:MAG: HAD family phosphatase [Chlamydiales bacterium]|nr:HAD family phosphatase [Chlamydiales bacterium]